MGKELAKSHVRLQNSIADLSGLHKQLAESHRQLEESLREVNEAQKKADERLNSFLAALERRFCKDGHF